MTPAIAPAKVLNPAIRNPLRTQPERPGPKLSITAPNAPGGSAALWPPDPANKLYVRVLAAPPGADQLLAPAGDLLRPTPASTPLVRLSPLAPDLSNALAAARRELPALAPQPATAAKPQARGSRRPAHAAPPPQQRGYGIGTVLSQAARVVQRGNGRLAAIAASFATEAAQAGPAALTPAGGARLMSSASIHFAKAVRAVAQTQDELAEYAVYLRPAALADKGPDGEGSAQPLPTVLAAKLPELGRPVLTLAAGLLTQLGARHDSTAPHC